MQGTDAWDQFRLEHFGASEAAAMLGLSKKTTRNELLRMKKTGIAKTFSEWLQVNVLDHGHEVEALARPHIEKLIGEDLYPVTCSDGKESASCDGLTMDDRIAMEHKQWNEALAASVAAGQVPDEHMPQCQQVLKVTGAEKLIFVVSDGTPENMLFVWVLPDPVWFERLRAGWAQFEQDLADYVPTQAAPVVVAAPVESLPAVSVRMDGTLTVVSNLPDFGVALRAFIAKIPAKASTDQEFADTDAACKALKKAEEALEAGESSALASMSNVEEMRRLIADYRNLARTTRLAKEKEVEARKVQIRTDEVLRGRAALDEHIATLNKRIGKPYMPTNFNADFAGAIKNKRTVESLKEAIDTTLANAKIATNEIAARIQINLSTLRELAADVPQLFPDTAQIVLKAPEDLTSLVKTRVADHRAAEEKKEDERREKIRKDLAMSEIQGIQQQVMIATLGRAGVRVGGTIECVRETLAETEAWPIDAERFGTLAGMAQQAKETAVAEIRALLSKFEMRIAAAAAPSPAASPSAAPTAVAPPSATPSSAPAAAPAPTVIPMPVRAAAAPTSAPTLSIGAINERLGHFTVTEAGLRGLGFEPAGRERAAPRYHEAEFPHMLASMANHLQAIHAKQAA
ncbi:MULTISPECIES: YqaJ viral recombinase family protein [unclassified Variovorax]|uniref:YqaJ viral recombinase family protein n=1 Tax=unclassified Variovorax TaxID=663243 RepID=UPI0034E85A4A